MIFADTIRALIEGPPPEPLPSVALRLNEARLCPDCELVFAGPTCPGCAGRSWWPLAAHLCRPATPARSSRRRPRPA